MTAPPTTATAVLAVVALAAVALVGPRLLRGRATTLGRGSFGGPRTSRRRPFGGRWRRWGSGWVRGRSRGGGSRRRRRSASLRNPPLDRRAIGRVGPAPLRSSHPESLLGGPRTGVPMGPMRARIPRPGRAAARRRHMEEAVPEVVGVLRATVAAGINPRRALQAAAEGAPAALQDVLGQAIGAAELGAGAGQALARAARSERLSELELAGEALDLAETTGAPPGPVLAGVATAAADRVRSRQARMAATAQARLSARVVAAMAPAFLGVLALTSPSDAAFLVREPAGWVTLAAAAVLELLGIAWSTRIVRGRAP